MKGYWGVEVLLLTSALDGGEWSASCPGHFTSRERDPGTHWIGVWVGTRTILDVVGQNILLSTLFSNTHSLCSSLSVISVRDQVSHPYKTTGKIIYILHIYTGNQYTFKYFIVLLGHFSCSHL